MSRLIIFSDVHGNLPALQAVLSQKKAGDEVYCLGDVVGYGPKPKECLHLLLEEGVHIIQGNHDREAVKIRRGEKPKANIYMQWTTDLLTDEEIEVLDAFPRSLRVQGDWGSLHLEHGDATGYIYPDTPDEKIVDHYPINEVDYIAFGHAHHTSYRPIGRAIMMSPGSVSYPRDGNPWPGFLLWDGERWLFNRVQYDVDAVIRDLREVDFLTDERIDVWTRRFKTGVAK